MAPSLWPHTTPGIVDQLFERLPGIPMSKREVRVLMLSQLRLCCDSVLWDIGAGTGTIPVEVGLLCPQGQVIAVERDGEVVKLIHRNCDRFGVTNVSVIEGNAPDCLSSLTTTPTHVIVEGGRPIKTILQATWERLGNQGRILATTNTLEGLYTISESFAELQVRHVEVVQTSVNRLEKRGNHQTFAALDPTFILSGEKLA
ncbi:precorrin-6Y C5,15-methyltransferase subunit CbiT [Prochlorothrix hollandica]|uniref:tRNA (guanine(46)-N(7))-methyltransferase n=1 Tax=Prochlorothrix hollandica PCC 9006 = CALU 1027 TaxID=317619 RepID=A0A0M2PYD8_PROHO|nr:precorrin-6Y C5,15-methyltransferase subunit CbiT [Prochlorothrix hollandica]KKJ01180.1 precorrin-6B methylase [Prochlorothrix hollandica PCC 9006 = CALU 1027]